MDNELLLDGLLVVSLTLSVLLVLISSAATGRHVANLEYQRESGINGIRTIQAWVNVRVHANRVMLALVFIFITTLLLADAPAIVRTFSFRILFALLMICFTVSSIMDWFGDRRQMQLSFADDVAAAQAVAPPAFAEPTPVDVRHLEPQAIDQIVQATTATDTPHHLGTGPTNTG